MLKRLGSLAADKFLQRRYLHLLFLAVAVVFAFSNSLKGSFHLDDHYLIESNAGIRRVFPLHRHFIDPSTISSLKRITQYRPMLPLTLSINYFFTGKSPMGFRVGNILFHFIAAIVVYFLVLELFEFLRLRLSPTAAQNGAFVASLVFGVHPVSGFPINYLSARDLILMTLFMVSSLLIYVRMRNRGASLWGWALSLSLFALALFSKTNGAVLPILIVLFEGVVKQKGIVSLKPWKASLPFWGVLAAQFAFKRFYVGFSDFTNAVPQSVSPFHYAAVQAKYHLFEYARNFIWPFYVRIMPEGEAFTSYFDIKVLLGALFIG
ncbi:MAG: hypothetical protein D6808_06620, partial [Candidatus Dadabacteria bacterium]